MNSVMRFTQVFSKSLISKTTIMINDIHRELQISNCVDGYASSRILLHIRHNNEFYQKQFKGNFLNNNCQQCKINIAFSYVNIKRLFME